MLNFALTGSGRTGTHFLARLLNKSAKWTVAHEPVMHDARSYSQALFNRQHPLITDATRVARRFNKDYYGEVNSLLRPVILDLDVAYRAILLRNPRDIWVSAFNKGRAKNMPGAAYDFAAQTLKMLDTAMEAGLPFWKFERYTTDLDYLQRLVRACGIQDLEVTPDMMGAVSPSQKFINSFEQLHPSVRSFYCIECGWFERKYYG